MTFPGCVPVRFIDVKSNSNKLAPCVARASDEHSGARL